MHAIVFPVCIVADLCFGTAITCGLAVRVRVDLWPDQYAANIVFSRVAFCTSVASMAAFTVAQHAGLVSLHMDLSAVLFACILWFFAM